jgi:NAD dependent epimerase/dehydratase family enzyme
MFGEMAQGTLLASQRVIPRRLIAAGYPFRHPTLETALRAAVNP